MVCVRWGKFRRAQLLIVSPQLQQLGAYYLVYITGFLNVRKISETMDFRTFVGPLVPIKPEVDKPWK